MDNQYVLRTEKIHKSFPGTHALKGVDFKLKPGEIHAIVGENGAGKSTLMNVISGVHIPESGKIFLKGEELVFKGPSDAQNKGVGFVHQELALCPHVTVAQNIFMGRLPAKNGIIDKNALNEETQKLLDLFHVNFSPTEKLSNLSVADQQIVEIVRALSFDCNVVIFDEPTSSLNEKEAKALFKVIRDIKDKGIGIVYISHKLSEIFELCDAITVMRDGNVIDSYNIKDVSAEKIITQMVGREAGNLYPPKSAAIHESEIYLKAENFTRYPEFIDVGFELRKGEILGLSGLVGSGRTELSRAICAIDECEKGELYLDNKKVKIRNYQDAIKNGLCYLTEDRKLDGLFLSMNITQNISASLLDRVSKSSIIQQDRIDNIASEYQKSLNIKISGLKQKVESLSGGNQQKVMIAKNLATQPKIIILDEPTRGIDVGAKAEIHAMLRKLCDQGIGVIIISSELPEVVGICDRVIVMHEGRVTGELSGDEITQENIIQKTSQFSA